MERITSRKNQYILRLRRLAADGAFRRDEGEYVLDGLKLLREAEASGAEITGVLWRDGAEESSNAAVRYTAPAELMEYASPLKNSPGPVFTVRMPSAEPPVTARRVIVLESVQDPGNVGTVIRTAAALGFDCVALVGACADPYSPRAARATMGAIFRQSIAETDTDGLAELVSRWDLPLYGAALCAGAEDIRRAELRRAAVAIGSEGQGLSRELLSMCRGTVIIPMEPDSESLNAAAAAAIIMWEMRREQVLAGKGERYRCRV